MTLATAFDVIVPRRRRVRSLAATFAVALSAACCLPAIAQTTSTPQVEAQPPTVRQIVDQQRRLRADVVAQKGAFKDLTQVERDELTKKQDRILQLLDGRDDISQLRVEEKVEVFNHLEWVSAVVRNAEEDRQVCERSRTVGSNRFQVVCMTAKEYRDHKERARQSLRTAVKCQGKETLGCKNEGGGSIGGGSLGGDRKIAASE